MIILGISAYHGDCSACLVKNGILIAAVEEERFTRVKHWAGFPEQSIRYCLEAAGLSLKDVDYVAVGRNTQSHLLRKAAYTLTHWRSLGRLAMRLRRKHAVEGILQRLISMCDGADELKTRIIYVEHHMAHLASACMVSGFEESAVLSIDGFGDFVSCMLGHYENGAIRTLQTVHFPHSVGLFYTAVTQLLGFTKYGDEFKVMGLAPYGAPVYKKRFEDVLWSTRNGLFGLDLSYFIHHSKGVDLTWLDGEPRMGPVYSEKFGEAFGPVRSGAAPLDDHHRNLAASVQAHTEDVIFALLNHLQKVTSSRRICLAGGVAMNSVANGKVFARTPFREMYVQPAAGDAGTSLGAAYFVYHSMLHNAPRFVMRSSYWGPEYSDEQLAGILQEYADRMASFAVEYVADADVLCRSTARHIAEGKVVGWFQGRMEWGARALGNRSILADPRNPHMKDILNARIKRREPFRPFAPSILESRVGEYFEMDCPDPFMTRVFPIRSEKRALLPAITHVDGTGRLQTVSEDVNPIYHKLICAFDALTGVPIVLNTSFNENEPIVCRPEEAIECFLRTKMDMLVLGRHVIRRSS
ncbi:MAG: carbamoyltransferase [Phycisphaerae bacterium]|nr:carbamoyltransferase [Phycisphaerae bacterium]